MKLSVSFTKLRPEARLPSRAHPDDAGFDIHAAVEMELTPGRRALISTGLSMEMPTGLECQVRPRSGLALKSGVTVLNSPGTIDAGYRGEIGVILINLGEGSFHITPGMRIAQLVFSSLAAVEINLVTELRESERGAGGFGSTG